MAWRTGASKGHHATPRDPQNRTTSRFNGLVVVWSRSVSGLCRQPFHLQKRSRLRPANDAGGGTSAVILGVSSNVSEGRRGKPRRPSAFRGWCARRRRAPRRESFVRKPAIVNKEVVMNTVRSRDVRSMVGHRTFNPRDEGSNPLRPTRFAGSVA